MGKIFKDNASIERTAYMNWRTRQDQPIYDMLIIADGYMKAAIMLGKNCLEDNRDKKADIVVFPMLFSANHAIELYLKAINWSLNILLNKNEIFCGGHDIRQIWNIVKKRISEFEIDKNKRKQFKDKTKKLEDYISELYEKIDKEHNAHVKIKNMDFSRYPLNSDNEEHFYIENKKNEVVDLEMFVEIFEKIYYNLSCLAKHYEEIAMFVPEQDLNIKNFKLNKSNDTFSLKVFQ